MKAIVSEKGQITIPKAVRDRLGLMPGTILEIEASEGRLVGVKRDNVDPVAAWRGAGKLPAGTSVDSYLDGTRESSPP